MNTDLINDLLHCYFQKCSKDPASFVSTFGTSDYIIAYHYRQKEQRFTEVSRSFKTILGYSLKNVLKEDVFVSKIIHPSDRPMVKEFLEARGEEAKENARAFKLSKQCLKIKAYHITGYWRHLIMYGTNCLDPEGDCMEKIGLIVKERIRRSPKIGNNGGLEDSRSVLVSGRIASQNPPVSQPTKITIREREVLKLISEGLVTKEIAEKLFISIGTVATHRRNLISKLKVKNTAELVKVASDQMLFTYLSS